MKQTLATIELANGDVHEDIRITAQDRLKLETTGRKHNWKVNQADSPYLTTHQQFLVWAALTRLGEIDFTFDQFRETELIDIEFKQAEAELGNPTRTGA